MATQLSRGQLTLACSITAAAGFVDGIGFLHLGGYFVSFMSGNSTRAAADLAAGDLLGWGRAIGLVGAFVAGVILAALLTRRPDGADAEGQDVLTPQVRAVWLSAVILAAGAGCATLAEAGAGRGWDLAVAPLIACAMGAVNSTFTRGGEVSVGLTYMTGALVKAGQLFAARLQGTRQTGWLRYAALWTAIALGSALGALAYLAWGLSALWAAVGLLVLCGVIVRRRRLS